MVAAALAAFLAQAHPVARECAAQDAACIARYDAEVLTAALVSSDRLVCPRYSTQPGVCLYLYDLFFSVRR